MIGLTAALGPQLNMSSNQNEVFIEYLTNQRIIVPRDSFLTCGDDRNPYNNIIKEEYISNKGYQIVSKEQWAYLESNYAEKLTISPGSNKPVMQAVYPIRRFYEKLGMGIRTFPDVHYHKVIYSPMTL